LIEQIAQVPIADADIAGPTRENGLIGAQLIRQRSSLIRVAPVTGIAIVRRPGDGREYRGSIADGGGDFVIVVAHMGQIVWIEVMSGRYGREPVGAQTKGSARIDVDLCARASPMIPIELGGPDADRPALIDLSTQATLQCRLT